MRFEDALRENPAPRRVGDVTLTYDPPVLLGQAHGPTGRSRYAPEALFLGALAAGAIALALLVSRPGAGVAGPLFFAVAAAALIAVATRVDARGRQPRRFVLHFLHETLRVDVPGQGFRRGTTVTVPFDDVRDLYVESHDEGRRLTLVVEVQTERGQRVPLVLVDGAGPDDAEALQRLWQSLRAAFALTPKEG